MTAPIIDAHGHVWAAPDVHPWERPSGPGGVESMVYSLGNYREEMDQFDADRAVLVATPIHGPGSPYTTECVRAHPDEFAGIVLADLETDDVAGHLDALFEHRNILGIRLGGGQLDAVPDALWRGLDRREKHVHLALSPPAYDVASQLIAAHPGITFVFDHLGLFHGVDDHPVDGPDFGRMAAIADHPNAYVKVTHTPSSARFPFEDIHDHVRFLYDAFGPDRLLWGSDYIYHFKRVTPWQTIEWLEHLEFLSADDRQRLLGETAASLLPA